MRRTPVASLSSSTGGAGEIVNISSVAGRTARAGNGVYAAIKWGINGWSEWLRRELLPDVRVTLIEPGVVATELPTHITHSATKEGVGKLYSRAEVTADDIAEVIAFVLARPPPRDPRGPAATGRPGGLISRTTRRVRHTAPPAQPTSDTRDQDRRVTVPASRSSPSQRHVPDT